MKHANFIVNVGGASAEDLKQLMARIVDAVRDTHGITLEPEIRLIHEGEE